jgi:hypothetical protein
MLDRACGQNSTMSSSATIESPAALNSNKFNFDAPTFA